MKQELPNLQLHELTIGDTAVIVRVQGPNEIRQRLLEMGLVKNVHVELLRIAPLGDPIVIKVHGFQLSLRKEEAALVEVRICGHSNALGKRRRYRLRRGQCNG